MNQEYDYVEMKIPAKSEYVGVVRLTISGIASRMGFSFDDIEDLKIAVSEACTNAVQHAYKEGEDGEILIGCGVYKDRLELMIADHGHSCNFDEVRLGLGPYHKDQQVEFMREGGLGIYLIETLMDRVEIRQHLGVMVFMTKFFRGERVEPDEQNLST